MLRTDWEALTADERRAYADPARPCIEAGCDEPAGTPWGPYWCAVHDAARLDRVSTGLTEIAAALAPVEPPEEKP